MKNRRINAIAGALVLSLIAAGILAVYIVRNTPNSTVVDPFDTSRTNLVIGDEWIRETYPPIISEGRILLPFDTIKAHIDQYIWYDEALQKITVTTRDRVIRMKTGSLDALVNEKPMELMFPAVEENGALYLPIDFLKEFYGINVRYIPGNDVVVIDFNNAVYRTAWPVNAKTVVRKGMSIHEPIVKKYQGHGEKGLDIDRTLETSLTVFDEKDEWYRVRANDGTLGYVKKEEVVVSGKQYFIEDEETTVNPVLTSGKINLFWHMTYSKSHIKLSNTTTPGIDVYPQHSLKLSTGREP